MDAPHSPLPDTASRLLLPPRSPSPPPQQHSQQQSFDLHNNAPSTHQFHIHDPYQHYSRPESRLSDSRLAPPPEHSAQPTPADDPARPASSSPRRYKEDNAPLPPYPCPVDQRWASHYSHAPYPQSFYPYPYHHQNMPHRVEDMSSVDRSISHRSDGHTQYQFMPSHPTPPPIATLHHSPALSASSLESHSISPSPPITQSSAPYYPHPAQAHSMNQAPPYPYQPNGNMARFADESNPAAYGAPPHAVPLSTRSIRPTIVPSQSYPGQASYIIYTDDANTKLSDRVRRKCFNCRTTDTSTWRRSSLTPGKVLCNKCGLFERTHSRPRPEQFPPKRGPVVPVNSFKQHRTVTPPSHAQQQQQQQQQQHQRLPPMSSQMLPPHHYSHPSLSPLMAARSADAQQYRAGGVTEIGALLNGPGESQANGSSGPSSGAPSAGGSPQLAHQQSPQQHDQQQQQQQQQQPNSLKRPASPLERQYQPPPPPQMQPETIQQHLQQQQQQQQQASTHSSPQISAAAAGASNSPKSSPRTGVERRDAPAYRASN